MLVLYYHQRPRARRPTHLGLKEPRHSQRVPPQRQNDKIRKTIWRYLSANYGRNLKWNGVLPPTFHLTLMHFFFNLCHWRTNFKLKRYWNWIIKLINFDLKLTLFSIIILTILSTPHLRHNTTRKYCATHHSHSPSLRRKHLFNHATMSSQPGKIDFNYVSRLPRPL